MVRLDQRTLFKASWKETRGVESATTQVITTHILGRENHSDERVKFLSAETPTTTSNDRGYA